MALKRHITKDIALTEFKVFDYPHIIRRYGKSDKTAIRCAWNDYVDMLEKEGRISAWQAETWVNPYDNTKRRR